MNSKYTPGINDVKAALDILAPTRLVWHQEQAGIIPNSCPEDTYGNSTKPNHADDASGGGVWIDWWQKHRKEFTDNLYWQLYKSLASYRMALREERGGHFVYDWIVRARFDVAWVRPLPPLRSFSRKSVWFGANYW